MAQDPVFTDPSAFNASVPAAPRVADASPIADALGGIGESTEQLGKLIYQQEQEAAVLKARIQIAKGFIELRREVDQETNFNKMKDAFKNGAEKIKNEALANTQDGKVERAIELDFLKTEISSEAHVFQTITRRKTEAQIAGLEIRADQIYAEMEIHPTNDLSGLYEKIDQEYLGGLNAGIGKDQMVSWREGQKQRLDVGRVMMLIRDNPSQAKELLEARTGKGTDTDPYANFPYLLDKRMGLQAKAETATRQGAAYLREMFDQALLKVGEGNPVEPIRAGLAANGANKKQLDDFDGRARGIEFANFTLDQITVAPSAQAASLRNDYFEKVVKGKDYYLQTALPFFKNRLMGIDKDWEDPGMAGAKYSIVKPRTDATLAERIAMSYAVQKEKGLKRHNWRPLPKAQAEEFVGDFNALNTAGRITSLHRLLDSSGRYKMDVIKQLREEKLPTWASAFLGAVTAQGYQDLGAAHEKPIPEMMELLSDRKVREDLRQEAIENIAEFGNTLAPGTELDLVDYQESLLRLSILYTLRGVSNPAETAYKTLFGDYAYSDTIKVPKAQADLLPNVAAKVRNVRSQFENINLWTGGVPQDVIKARAKTDGKAYLSDGDTKYRFYLESLPLVDGDKLKSNVAAGMSPKEAVRASQIQFTLEEGLAFGLGKTVERRSPISRRLLLKDLKGLRLTPKDLQERRLKDLEGQKERRLTLKERRQTLLSHTPNL